MLDTLYAIETPEGMDLTLRPAGAAARVMAYGIDLSIRLVVVMILGTLLAKFGRLGTGVLLILYFLIEWFYPVLFEVYRQGMTPGKKSLRLRVVHDDGTPVSWNASVVRNLLRAVDFLPFAYCAGLVSMVASRDFKRLGDIAAGTLVVYQPDAKAPAQHPSGSARPSPIRLSGDEQALVLQFAERRPQLSEQRQQELADILTPLTGRSGGSGVVELTKIANGLVGQA